MQACAVALWCLLMNVVANVRIVYRKSYEREWISWFMGTSNVWKVLKTMDEPWANAIWELLNKTSRLNINHELHQQVHTIFHLLYSQQNFVLKHCTRYSLHKILQLFPKCSHVLYEPIRKIMSWQASLFKFLSPQICIELFNLNLMQWLYYFTRGTSLLSTFRPYLKLALIKYMKSPSSSGSRINKKKDFSKSLLKLDFVFRLKFDFI